MGKDVKKLKTKGGGKVNNPVLSFLPNASPHMSRKAYSGSSRIPRGVFSFAKKKEICSGSTCQSKKC